MGKGLNEDLSMEPTEKGLAADPAAAEDGIILRLAGVYSLLIPNVVATGD